MKNLILLSATALAFASCEPVDSVGRVLHWELESGGMVVDTIAPTTIFNQQNDINESYINLGLDFTTEDAVLDSSWTFFL